MNFNSGEYVVRGTEFKGWNAETLAPIKTQKIVF